MRIVIYPDGSNNFPGHAVSLPGQRGNWPEEMINLAVGHYEVSGGVIELDARTTSLNLRGDGLALKLDYQPHGDTPGGPPSYRVELGSRGLRVLAGGLAPQELAFSSRFTLEKSRLVISALRLSTAQSRADFKGVLENPLAPHGVLNVQAAISLREAVAMLAVPLDPAGSANFAGTLGIDFANLLSRFAISGRVNARGVGYSSGRLPPP